LAIATLKFARGTFTLSEVNRVENLRDGVLRFL